MSAYYNENDPHAARWLRNLIAAGQIAPGYVDERSITDIHATDLAGFRQCHFFAGIGGWSYALRLAGWSDDRPVWTGSCPCQPFSGAGQGKAADDQRHLWPAWMALIRECRPAIVFGEQVEAAVGWGWLDLVLADLEQEGYACGATVLPACSVGAPHIRNRLWFVADAEGWRGNGALQSGERERLSEPLRSGSIGELANSVQPAGERGTGSIPRAQAQSSGEGQHNGGSADGPADGGEARGVADDDQGGRSILGASRLHDRGQCGDDAARCGADGNMADAAGTRRGEQPERDAGAHGRPTAEPGRLRDAGELDDAEGQRSARDETIRREAGGGAQHSGIVGVAGEPRLEGHAGHGDDAQRREIAPRSSAAPGASDFWADLEWLSCTDGKARPVEPGTFPLAHGISGRVGRLRAYGNAIVPQVAAQFIRAATHV